MGLCAQAAGQLLLRVLAGMAEGDAPLGIDEERRRAGRLTPQQTVLAATAAFDRAIEACTHAPLLTACPLRQPTAACIPLAYPHHLPPAHSCMERRMQRLMLNCCMPGRGAGALPAVPADVPRAVRARTCAGRARQGRGGGGAGCSCWALPDSAGGSGEVRGLHAAAPAAGARTAGGAGRRALGDGTVTAVEVMTFLY